MQRKTTIILLALTMTTAAACTEEAPEVPETAEAVARLFSQGAGAGHTASRDVANAAINIEGKDMGLNTPESVKPCVEAAWGRPFEAIITWNNCATPEGQVMQGAASIGLTFIPLGVEIALDDLQIGEQTFEGGMALSLVIGRGGLEVLADLDFTFTTPTEGATTLQLRDAALTASRDARIIAGRGAIATDEIDVTLEAQDVTWRGGDCHPSSGALFYSDGLSSPTITYLPDTPQTGVVLVQVTPQAPAVEVALLTPCK